MNPVSSALIDSFDPFVVQQAEIGASRLVRARGFHPDDWEDLRQELLVDYLERLPQFDPSRGDARGFMFGVVRHRAAQLVTQHARRVRAEAFQCEECRRTVEPEFDLRLDVAAVVDRLPEQLRQLALALQELTPSEAARRFGKTRARVRQLSLQIRAAFLEAGITPAALHRCGGAQ
jgi:RNA polymerase sigma-70 factor (ECF subfamily)